ncbi:protein of unknown function [Denitratisoma oestradiolicum]|uniref:Uncharacterized protein n=1 Tax=Denitratisoma oestradiolicum TaxID=311182 RepID=A0A6S6XVU9_9PROT|nr:protein of unknown function [Denitratisoma oestradiolicum]
MPSTLERQTRASGYFLNLVQGYPPQVILDCQVNAIPTRRNDSLEPGNPNPGLVDIESRRRCRTQPMPLQDWHGFRGHPILSSAYLPSRG